MGRTLIIAEAGVNHNGSMEMARQLVDTAAAAGADIVKFQTFKAEKLVTASAQKARYQVANMGDGDTSQLEMLKKLELTDAMHDELQAYCQQKGIAFLSTPFDLESMHMLIDRYAMAVVKIPSGELTNGPFLLEVGRKGVPIILSTGMATLGEVEQALMVLAYGLLNQGSTALPKPGDFETAYFSEIGQQALKEKASLLHCTTEYPAPMGDINLKAMDTLAQAFGLRVGYSDHTEGILVPIAAVARGATIIEKHFTLDRNLPGPDHKASLEPAELKAMVDGIRAIETALGDGRKMPSANELSNRSVARKSLHTARDIRKGDVLSANDFVAKRPGSGISPMHLWEYIGAQSQADYQTDDLFRG